MDENHLFCVNTLIVLQQEQSNVKYDFETSDLKRKSMEGIRKESYIENFEKL